jgi:hypothetical protein
MAEDNVLPQAVERENGSIASRVVSGASRAFAAQYRDAYSFRKQAVAQRVFASCIRGCEPPAFVKAGNVAAKDACDLAVDYATYKLAALCRAAEFDSDFLGTVRLSLAQNRLSGPGSKFTS